MLDRLFKGHPIGSAMEYIKDRYAALSTELTAAIDDTNVGRLPPNPYEMAEMWTSNNDARGYVIIGDPAVRLYIPDREEPSDDSRDKHQQLPPSTN